MVTGKLDTLKKQLADKQKQIDSLKKEAQDVENDKEREMKAFQVKAKSEVAAELARANDKVTLMSAMLEEESDKREKLEKEVKRLKRDMTVNPEDLRKSLKEVKLVFAVTFRKRRRFTF